jgi:hypothetical protein
MQTVTLAAPVKFAPLPVAKTETFTMRDEPDFNLTTKEMNMVVKAIGIGAKPKTMKKK